MKEFPFRFGKILFIHMPYIPNVQLAFDFAKWHFSWEKKNYFWMFSHLILTAFWVCSFFFFFFCLILLELVDLPLVKFDFSCNKVLVIPICFREMKQLQILLLENNPLQSPPAQVRGLAVKLLHCEICCE